MFLKHKKQYETEKEPWHVSLKIILLATLGSI